MLELKRSTGITKFHRKTFPNETAVKAAVNHKSKKAKNSIGNIEHLMTTYHQLRRQQCLKFEKGSGKPIG